MAKLYVITYMGGVWWGAEPVHIIGQVAGCVVGSPWTCLMGAKQTLEMWAGARMIHVYSTTSEARGKRCDPRRVVMRVIRCKQLCF